MTARALSDQHRAEAMAFPPGLDRDYHARAAWTLDQMANGIPSQDWTKEPPEGLAAYIERMEIAA